MSKDRFKEFEEKREIFDDGTDVSILNYFAVVDMEAPYLVDFLNRVNALRDSINKITKLIAEVELLQHAMLAPQISIEKKEKLETSMTQVKLLGHQIRKEINQMKQTLENPSSRKIYRRIIENQIDAITKSFCGIMDQYYQSTMNYREKCKGRVQRQYEIAGLVKTDSQIEEILQTGRFTIYKDIIVDTEQAKEQLNLLELRHQELTSLENGILDLHDMMFDIANLVQGQGDHITDIRDNIALVNQQVEEIPPIINDAQRISHCFPSKKKICLLVITIVLTVYLISNSAAAFYHSIFTTVTGGVLPVEIMFICALLIHHNLSVKRQHRFQLNVNQQNTTRSKNGDSQSRRYQQVLFMLLVQVSVYGILMTPLMIWYFYSAITLNVPNKSSDRVAVERFTMFTAELIIFGFPTSSFYLYTMASQIFRAELMAMMRDILRCKWSNNPIRIGPMPNENEIKIVAERISRSNAITPVDNSGQQQLESVVNNNHDQLRH